MLLKNLKLAQFSKYPVTLIYIAFAWKVLEASDVFIARFDLPSNTFIWMLLLLIVGLIFLLVLAFVGQARKPAILIVDDHAMVRAGLRNLLLSITKDRKVYEAANGLEAVKLATKYKYDLVFTDVNMPIMSGVEVCTSIKKNNDNTKVVAYTMLDDKHTVRKMLTAGASGYLLKSSSLEELKFAIEAVLHGDNYFSLGLEPI